MPCNGCVNWWCRRFRVHFGSIIPSCWEKCVTVAKRLVMAASSGGVVEYGVL